jgi:hypothetical protein
MQRSGGSLGFVMVFHDKNSSKVEKEVFQESQFLEICPGIIGWLKNSSISKSYDRSKWAAFQRLLVFHAGVCLDFVSA